MHRSDIECALNDLIFDECGMRFQGLAVVLAKKRWPDLIASERKWDDGLDAFAPAIPAQGIPAKGLASSITGTLDKIREDAKRIQEKRPEVGTLIFYTPQKVTNYTAGKWAEEIHRDFGFQLLVVSREDVITSLLDPSNAPLCRTHLGISIPSGPAVRDLLPAAKEASAQETENLPMPLPPL